MPIPARGFEVVEELPEQRQSKDYRLTFTRLQFAFLDQWWISSIDNFVQIERGSGKSAQDIALEFGNMRARDLSSAWPRWEHG